MAYYPIMLNILDKKCLVIGGGKVAYRKILPLLEFGATVTALSSYFTDEILELPKNHKVNLIRRSYQKNDVDNYFLVVVATNDRIINKEISNECKKKNILVNVVDDKELSTFIVPSVMKKGDLTISVSTNGKSPLLAKRIKEMLGNMFEDDVENLIAELSNLRDKLKTTSATQEEKIKLYDDIINKYNILRGNDKK
ncbi:MULTISPECIES: precorrin-2 dehydrogenase/sirohydrochlorin ferrochelatase family protein [Thermoanaerobacterium]|uniref:precorrin-2 dehydrogenase n=2 Tax=Thermoanaerobacterium TaxID=28895 RepID=W9EAX2_9THEO|nr:MULTISPECIES: bifunctional precorrin-2 dehydrogenase/sirohydrochlorin ferrochelatase [Thermoanaerobacterium]AFK86659.1 siroheme synthase [Thermoanaerobacterium saccharolyticum JW/SL-YS485]ETO38326.1 siroheme synthase [Thermoanaerobacterium aotearoense SCUT27]